MILKPRLLVIALCIFFISASSFKKHPQPVRELPATALHPYGRYIINSENKLELISSAVHVGFSFTGKKCSIFLSLPNGQNHNYIQYELDGVYEKRIKVTNSNAPIVISAAAAGMHTVWLYKTTEAHSGAIIINKISAANIKALKKPVLPFIEFIGNSITCGAAADPSETPCGTGEYQDQHNAYNAYGPRVARALKTNFMLSSVSGIGIYRNWNSDGPTMPQVYEKTDFQDANADKWNFSLYSPKIVSIALGTNDFSNGDGKKTRLPFDSSAFVNSYIDFVKLVKTKYPKAQIALLSSAMVNGGNRVLLQNCLTAVQQQINDNFKNDKPIATFFFEPMQARGCGGHPSVEDHAILAKQLIPFFKKLLAGKL